jgi:FkbM family methyltransferase
VVAAVNDALHDLLRPERPTAVVDVGANPVDGDPPYKALLQKRLCRVVGFEPQPEALAKLNARKSDCETYLPYVIGDGSPQTLRICASDGMTSLLRPNAALLHHLGGYEFWGRVTAEVPVTTRRLDDIAEIEELDFLKIDVQGSELSVFRHATRLLRSAVAIQTEVSFLPLYEEQPVFGAVDLALRERGFVPHAFAGIRRGMISPMAGAKPDSALNQLLEADVVYVRDFTKSDAMTSEQLKHLALVAHHCYQSYDLAMNCIFRLQERQAVAMDAVTRYLNLMRCRT